MAKVTITLEDIEGPDGAPGLTVDWQSGDDFIADSLAHAYAAEFVQAIMNNAGKAEIIDKDGAEITDLIIKENSEKDPSLN